MTSNGAFKHLMDEFGGSGAEKEEEEAAEEEEAIEDVTADESAKIAEQRIAKITKKHMGKAAGTGKLEVGCVQSVYANALGTTDGVRGAQDGVGGW